ncbi:MAG: flagellar hook-associated protein FlgK [Lachnospiraceae bacterium]|nr:flagellar hook-associated protein FlgK [Lachnospiraceae bacterium]
MSLFGNLYVGASGLQTGQNALNTIAHNLSNQGTKGFTRQQISLTDSLYNTLAVNSKAVANKQVGSGVTYAEVRQVRDVFLDKTYRQEAGRASFYEVSYTTLEEVGTLLGELDGESFSASLKDLWESVQELSKEPASSVTQGLLVQRASRFVEQASNVYTALSNYQDNLNYQVKQQVDKINEYAKRIFDLNESITKIEVGGIEHANDLKDERNMMLDELGKLGNIEYYEDIYGGLTVKFEGRILVNSAMTFNIALMEDPDNGFYTPYWEFDAEKKPKNGASTYDPRDPGTYDLDIDGAQLYDMTMEIQTKSNTDVGTLKGMLLARGDHRANYTDLDFEDVSAYNDNISTSIIMNTQAEFDNLIHNIVTELNRVLEEAAEAETAKFPDSTYLRNADGSVIQLFARKSCEAYNPDGSILREDLSRVDDDGNPVKDSSGSRIDPTSKEVGNLVYADTLYTLGNLIVNPDLVKEPTKLGFIKSDNKEDFAIATELQRVFDKEDYRLNPMTTTKANLMDIYSNIVSQVANQGAVFKSIYSNEQSTVTSTDNARQQVLGVSDDEELQNMIKFQNAYNASSRYINVVSELLEHIINTLGT